MNMKNKRRRSPKCFLLVSNDRGRLRTEILSVHFCVFWCFFFSVSFLQGRMMADELSRDEWWDGGRCGVLYFWKRLFRRKGVSYQKSTWCVCGVFMTGISVFYFYKMGVSGHMGLFFFFKLFLSVPVPWCTNIRECWSDKDDIVWHQPRGFQLRTRVYDGHKK